MRLKSRGVTKHTLLLFILIVSLPPCRAQNIVINEFLASNSSINQDPDYHNYSDWIEIYNTTDSAIHLGGF